jgi:hypothetical protein
MCVVCSLFHFDFCLFVLAVALLFVVASSVSLPPIVASHFSWGGRADGFMSRSGYIRFIAILVVVMPLLLPVLFRLVRYLPPAAEAHLWMLQIACTGDPGMIARRFVKRAVDHSDAIHRIACVVQEILGVKRIF